MILVVAILTIIKVTSVSSPYMKMGYLGVLSTLFSLADVSRRDSWPTPSVRRIHALFLCAFDFSLRSLGMHAGRLHSSDKPDASFPMFRSHSRAC
ncbi:hypothetical protein BJY52DRAFT_755627 [Lactarius psammicola]|nr:hypothetical protein BJY52DRAFT_755627 [Lactarius psammicola]